MENLGAKERIVLAIDTANSSDAEYWSRVAKKAGTRFIKMGLEFSTAFSWKYCSELALANNLQWIADAKLDDIPNTVGAAVSNLIKLPHPPAAITVHTTAGIESMKAARAEAGDTNILGVTILTSVTPAEAESLYGMPLVEKVVELAASANKAGLAGVVASPKEIARIKNESSTKNLLTMIPGTRSAGVNKNDQSRTMTPAQAIMKGADLLVIGRQITQAKDPAAAYNKLIAEIEEALEARRGE